MNTKIRYMYRDGSNFKASHALVLAGTLTPEQIREAMTAGNGGVHDEPQFIPGQIGLPDLQDAFSGPSMWSEDRDHPWHTLLDVEMVDQAPDGGELPTAPEFHASLMSTEWDEDYRPASFPMMELRALGYGDAEAGTLHQATNGDGTGLYYTLGLPRLGVSVTRSPSDPDMLLVQYGTIPQMPDELQADLDTLGYELADGVAVRDCTGGISYGLDALKLMVEANHAARGIDGDSEEIRPEQLNEAYIRGLIGHFVPEAPEDDPEP